MNYRQLATILQVKSYKQFLAYIKEKWSGADVQESVFRLFAYLKLIPDFQLYHLTIGNFNKQTIDLATNIGILLDKNIKDKGDKSDFTAIQMQGGQMSKMIITTSKNLVNYGVNDLDILKLKALSIKYKNCETTYCVVVPNKNILFKKINAAEASSQDIVDILIQSTTIIIDHADLEVYFKKFAEIHGDTDFDDFNTNKNCIHFKFHQQMTINKTITLMKNHNKILWGHMPRSGKSYIMAGLMHRLYQIGENIRRYLIITTAPSETVDQYKSLFNSSIEFNDFDIVHLPNDLKNLSSENSRIVICSKQYLHSKLGGNRIKKLARIRFDCLFFDESHYGGTTERCEEILATYKSSCQIFITATYQKPAYTYNISNDACLLWDIEDNTLAKKIDIPGIATRLFEKHGPEFKRLLKQSNLAAVRKQYINFPELHIITPELLADVRNEIKNLVNSNYGFSVDSLFMLQHDAKIISSEFINKDEVIKFMQYVFGTPQKLKHIEVPDHRGLLTRAADIAQRNGMDYYAKMPIILIFLPCNMEKTPIAKLSTALRNIIETYFIEFGCVDINSHANKGQNVKSIIYENYQKAKLNNKKALIVLSGKQATLGISLQECHTVILLNNTTSMDMLYQMMFRSMTEQRGKTCGFVIDLNIHRAITLITDYSYNIKNTMNNNLHDMTATILKQRLITFNYDEYFEVNSQKFNDMIDKIVSIWAQPNSIGSILQRINIKNNLFSQTELTTIGGILSITKQTAQEIETEILKLADDIPKGIEKEVLKLTDEQPAGKPVIDTPLPSINITQQFLIYIIPLLCLLSIDLEASSLDAIMNFIEQNKNRNNCLAHQLQVFYPNIMPASILKVFMLIYNRGIKNNKANVEMITRLKELFSLHLRDRNKLGELIDKYLIPHVNERRKNAEVSTPYALRQEMLNSITEHGDVAFWKTPKTVFEPCCGKGGFVVDIIERFMNDLAEMFPDKAERYRYIIEHCIYFADINPLNIFITRLLLDPFGKYKLNYYLGDTLKIDIHHEFKLEGFDLVVGNPPYQKNTENGRSAKNHSLYIEFMYFGNKILKNGGYLIYINPSSWMSYSSNNISIINQLFRTNTLLYLNIEGAKNKYFKKIGSTFCWYIMVNNNINLDTKIECYYKNKIYKTNINIKTLNFMPLFATCETISIIHKLFNENKHPFKIETNTSFHYGIKKNKEFLKTEKTKVFTYKIAHTPSQTLYSSKKHALQDSIKLFIPLTTYYESMFIDRAGMTQGCYFIQCISHEDAERTKKNMLCKLYRFVNNICRWGNFNSPKIFTKFPNINNLTNPNDIIIYNYFNLTDKEIQTIENYFQ